MATAMVGTLAAGAAGLLDAFLPGEREPRTRIVIVHDPRATRVYEPQATPVRAMVHRGLTNITAQPTVAAAWLSLLSTQDVVGLKVWTAPGPTSGTRLAVVEALVETLLEAGLPPRNIVVWDRQRLDLRQAGYLVLEQRHGIRVEGSSNTGYDEGVYYDPDIPFLGPLIWSDLEFGQSSEGAGRKSFVSKLVSRQLTRIVNVSPLLNHYGAGVTGNLYSLARGSVDNTQRFEINPAFLAQAIPEIYALPAVGDKVVLNIVDALICQYQGQQVGRLHYATALNEIRFSRDPVALDLLSVDTLTRQRRLADVPAVPVNQELFANASLLQLGVSQLSQVLAERLE